jgi:allantoate deiminase
MPPVDPAIAARLHARVAELGTISEEPGRLTRSFFSEAMTRVHARFAEWAAAAGLTFAVDPADNLRLRWYSPGVAAPAPLANASDSAAASAAPSAPRPLLVIGSHLDTVRDAGRYDGPLGVLTGLACVEQLQAWGAAPPFDLEIVGFSDEEGLRFQTAYLGSAYYAGVFPEAWLTLRDAAGLSLGEVLSSRGQAAADLLARQAPPAGLLGYLELHIEQGPQLAAEACAVGVVSAIAAQTRARLVFTGRAGHAGTTPMALRQDALCAAAEAVLAIEAQARATPGLRATVGQLAVQPGASNVIPAGAVLTLDIRHAEDATLADAVARLRSATAGLAAARGVDLVWEFLQQGGAVLMDPVFTEHLRAAAAARQGAAPVLVSGAGHDAAVLGRVCPVAMLFVRNRDGLSHHPDEYVEPADAELGLAILADAVVRLASAR